MLVGCDVMVGDTGAALTVRVTVELGVLPAELLTTAWNVEPLSAVVVAGVVKLEAVAPEMLTPFFFHWYVSGAVPVATTLNVADCPTVTV